MAPLSVPAETPSGPGPFFFPQGARLTRPRAGADLGAAIVAWAVVLLVTFARHG